MYSPLCLTQVSSCGDAEGRGAGGRAGEAGVVVGGFEARRRRGGPAEAGAGLPSGPSLCEYLCARVPGAPLEKKSNFCFHAGAFLSHGHLCGHMANGALLLMR